MVNKVRKEILVEMARMVSKVKLDNKVIEEKLVLLVSLV